MARSDSILGLYTEFRIKTGLNMAHVQNFLIAIQVFIIGMLASGLADMVLPKPRE
jgi:hypothetical protein